MSDQLDLWGHEPGDRLRWSVSRHRRINDCLRKYYLFHFASRGGQAPMAPRRARELVILKSLRNRHMWVGQVVHDLLELALAGWRRHDNAPVDALVDRGTRIMRAHYAESVQGVYRERPMSAMGLVEHEYAEPVSREQWRAQRDHMELCVRNFYGLAITKEIQTMPHWRWLAVETLGSFELDSAKIIVRPDFAWRDEEDRVVMVDWKTGWPRPDAEDLQLAVYGLFARRSWGLGSDHLRAMAVYLATGEVREKRIELAELQQAEDTIRASLARMRELTVDQEDLDTPETLERFPLVEDADECKRCGFKRVCGRD